MKYILMLPRVLWKLWFLINFLISLFIFYPLLVICMGFERGIYPAFTLMRIWAHYLLYASGIFPSVKTKINWETISKPCVVIANHCSYLDVILSYAVIPDYFFSIAKQELNKAPLFRIVFKRMNILVDRKSVKDSHRAFVRAGEELEKGHILFVFPEATISREGKLKPFKNGGFKLAIEKQIPIVPMIFLNNWKLLQNGGFFTAHGKPGFAHVVVEHPLSTKNKTEADLVHLRDEAYHIINDTLKKYNDKN